VAIKFSNSHFHIQNCRFRALFCRFTANQAEIQKRTTDSMFTTPWACIITEHIFLLKKRDYSGSRVGIGIEKNNNTRDRD
jgi:hypothetical protein